MKELFDEIFETFENKDIKEFAMSLIEYAPRYWYSVPASSTGKYHPSYSLGDGGLVRHTIALIRLLNHMFSVESVADQYTSRERDLLRVAGLAHDMWKSGTQEDYEKSKWTKFDHPMIAAWHIRQLRDLPKDEIEFIADAIESHMGQWNTDKRNPDIVLPKPQNKYQIILHLADYLASRKDIELKFDGVPHVEEQTKPDVNTWKFTFGKYNGKTIPEVYNEDPGYIKWAKENMDREPAKSLLKEFVLA
jgi:HD superfamily phosphohydrolase YqeK